MEEDKEITAHFDELLELELSVEGNGTTDPEPGVHLYEAGEEVDVEALPHGGWEFSHWSGDVSSESIEESRKEIVMDEDKQITAHFEERDEEEAVEEEDEAAELTEVERFSRWWLLLPLIGMIVSIVVGHLMDRDKKKR